MGITKYRESKFSFADRSRYIESVEFELHSSSIPDFEVIEGITNLTETAELAESREHPSSIKDYEKVSNQDAWLDLSRFTSKGNQDAALMNFLNSIDAALKDETARSYVRQFENEEDTDEAAFPDHYEMILIHKNRAYKLVLTKDW